MGFHNAKYIRDKANKRKLHWIYRSLKWEPSKEAIMREAIAAAIRAAAIIQLQARHRDLYIKPKDN